MGYGRPSSRVLGPFFLALAVLQCLPSGAGTPIVPRVQRPDEDLLLFAVRLDQDTLSDSFPAFPAGDRMLVPIGELCRLLELGIRSDPLRGRAEGFFIAERRSFSLDAVAGTVLVEGRPGRFERAGVELHDDDIYVDTRLLEAWLPLDLKVARSSATIAVCSREPLPLQERRARERRPGPWMGRTEPKNSPADHDPYRLAEVPMLDETLRAISWKTPESGHRLSLQSTTCVTGDFLGLTSSLYAFADTEGNPSEFRVTMGRRDPHGALLGPLRATEFSFGHILAPGVDLLTLSAVGEGALVTNEPLVRQGTFDRRSFTGGLLPGWQVELYQNDALMGFQAVQADGKYAFLDIPLYFGANDFRLVFYGPQGQRREERTTYDISENQTREGVFTYRLQEADPDASGKRSQAEFTYGLAPQASLGLSTVRLESPDGHHAYTQANLQGFWKPCAATLTIASDQTGGSATELALRSQVGRTRLTGRLAELRGGFSSEIYNPQYGAIRDRYALDSSTSLPGHCTFDLGVSRDQLAGGGRRDQLTQRISATVGRTFLSSQLVHTTGHGEATSFPTTHSGSFLASSRLAVATLRGEAIYQLEERVHLDSLLVALEVPASPTCTLRASLGRTFADQDNVVRFGLQKTQGAFALGADWGYSRNHGFSMDLLLRLGIAREPRKGRVNVQGLALAGQGAASAFAFLDANGNGCWDPGERPVQGTGFLANGSPTQACTDAQGIAFLPNLPSECDTALSVRTSTLEDPLMKPSRPRFRLAPRPGHITRVDVPLVILGEVAGTVFLRSGQETRPLPGLELELVDAAGGVARRTRTAYDGYYDLPELPPGAYRLRVALPDLERLGLASTGAREITLEADGTVLDGLDLILQSQGAP